jgi:dTDP-4-dehydrorhamnose 3,5-epimerase
MKILATDIAGVTVIERTLVTDNRGSFSRLFCARELQEVIGERNIAQINHSHTNAIGAVRGLHFQQAPHAEMKVVTCLKGKVWDVAVDLRRGSKTLLRWHCEELSSTNCKALVVPEGCAHGFQVLEADSELLYLHTAFYNPAAEGGVRPTDPRVAISWPLPIVDLSVRDQNHSLLSEGFSGLVL